MRLVRDDAAALEALIATGVHAGSIAAGAAAIATLHPGGMPSAALAACAAAVDLAVLATITATLWLTAIARQDGRR